LVARRITRERFAQDARLENTESKRSQGGGGLLFAVLFFFEPDPAL
jgi:hypothetical protein